MNLGIEQLSAACDVLVVGAGPAGCGAAITLAQAGHDVVLVDSQAFPRDKICGDGLIPDAHNALRRLGVLDEVLRQAQASGFVRCIGPRGGHIDVPGTLAVLPRKQLDLILCQAAVRAGAKMFAPLRFIAPIEVDGVVTGATLQQGDATRELRARWVVLASGAVPQALIAAGMSTRTTPSGVALRGYVKNDAMIGRIDKLEFVWHRAVTPGYGWIFPCADGVFNIGVGIAESHNAARDGKLGKLAKREANLREVMQEFTRIYAPARDLMAGGTLLGPMKGAPLRCSLEGARYTRPGLLVVGDAVGSTYSFSGEGIGKAMETGMLAAGALLAGHTGHDSDAAVRAAYEASLRALKPRFELYQRANNVNRYPWLVDLLVWRAKSNPGLLRRMSGVLNETSNPGNLVSFKGLRRLLFE